MTDLSRIRAIVTSWRDRAELSAARCMLEIAKELEIDPPKPVAGKVRKRGTAQMEATEPLDDNRHDHRRVT